MASDRRSSPNIPSSELSVIREPQYITNYPLWYDIHLGNGDSSFTEVICVLDKFLYEPKAWELNYMLEPDSSGGPVMDILD